jgi:hypothetical protein
MNTLDPTTDWLEPPLVLAITIHLIQKAINVVSRMGF